MDGRGKTLKHILFALQDTPPPCLSMGSGEGRELRDGSPPSTDCLLWAPPPYSLGLLATSLGMQAPQSPPTFQAEPGGFTTGQCIPFPTPSSSLPPYLRAAENLEWGIDLGLCSRQFTDLMLGGYLLLRDPASYQQQWKARWLGKGEEKWGVANLALPGPLA